MVASPIPELVRAVHPLRGICTLGTLPSALATPIDEPIQPVPLTLKQDPARAELGRLLFQDVRLSGNGRVSCRRRTLSPVPRSSALRILGAAWHRGLAS